MNSYETELRVMKEIAQEAGNVMLTYFNQDQHVEIKEDATPVTIADKLINTLVIERLQKEFPLDGIIGEEESTAEYGMGRKWLCDPIDGTKPYTWGVPTAVFSLALVVDGTPVVGVVYDPFLNNLYVGEAGKKSFCNTSPLLVSETNLHTGTVAVTSSFEKLMQTPFYKKIIEHKINIACFSGGIYKSTLVARGKFTAYVEYTAKPHDMAAVQLIVEGAGGKVTGIDGKPLDYSKSFTGAIVSNGIAHDELVDYSS